MRLRDLIPSFGQQKSTPRERSLNPPVISRPEMRAARKRRVLVVVRAGSESLHEMWLCGAGTRRNWDLHISYFDDSAASPSNLPADVTTSIEPGTKSQGLVECLTKLADRIKTYDWVWLPDDDLAADSSMLNKFFDVVSEYELALAQPALGAGSHVSYDLTRQRPHMKLRYTTFVDIMAPCFSRQALAECLPHLDEASCGPEFLFPQLLGYPKDRIAIVDETPVVHTQPLGGPTLDRADRLAECEAFLARHSTVKRFETWSGISRERRAVTNLLEIDRLKAPTAVAPQLTAVPITGQVTPPLADTLEPLLTTAEKEGAFIFRPGTIFGSALAEARIVLEQNRCILQLAGGNEQAESSGTTGGYSVRVPDQLESFVSEKNIQITAVVRAKSPLQASRVALAYSTNDAGNSGWHWFEVGHDWQLVTMDYAAPKMNHANGDFIGILPDGNSQGGIEIASITVHVLGAANIEAGAP
jgi:hypothetical protein